MINTVSLKHWSVDLAGGVTTAVVSLPLALTFGVASGLGAQAGLYGAVMVGLFAALFGGSTRLISEPTGPMTVIMTSVVAQLMADHPEKGVAMAFTVVMLAGAFQILLGAMKLGQFITQMPYSVISGFMSGIGIILILLQIPALLGQASPAGGVMGVVRNLPDLVQSIQGPELLLGAAALALLLFYPDRFRRKFPPQLAALVLGTVASMCFFSDAGMRRIGEIPMGLPTFYLPTFEQSEVTRLLFDAIVLGTLGSIDTLLSAMVADSLTRETHNSDRELIGQGIANTISGICGGLPGAGATMGTVVNIQTGAQTILAGIIRALLLLLVLLVAAPLTAPVPLTILAAIALKVGIDILDWSFLKRVHLLPRTTMAIMYSVLLLTVFADLIVAVGIGVFIANLLTIQRLSRYHAQHVRTISDAHGAAHLSERETELMNRTQGHVLLFHLSGPMIFGVAKAIAREHAAMDSADILVIDLSDVPMMSTTVALAIENVALDAQANGMTIYVAGAGGESRKLLDALGMFALDNLHETECRLTALEQAASTLS